MYLCAMEEIGADTQGVRSFMQKIEMLITLAGQDESNWRQATRAAELAITSRIKLWDSVQAHLYKGPTVQHRIG
jgi:hypothetical protein